LEQYETKWKKEEVTVQNILKNFSGARAKHEVAIGIQSLLARRYARQCDEYRMASYFLAAIILLDTLFLLAVAVVRESCLRQSCPDAATSNSEVCRSTINSK
jgi:hypothetical protein